MNYYKAEITDVLRGAQRDELFVDSVKEDIFAILKLFGVVNYSRLRKIVPVIANTWYYYVTSLSNFQTLGEEYTGTLRFTNRNQIPGKFLQICWLVFYVGGESIYDGFLEHLNQYITTNKSMTDDAKQKFVNIIFFLKDNKLC
ncbi:hypothetical protein FQA39_LY02764 [Lamprigera yunnana]|nr:hypothetical protein FQA39_LY02764 [Lamprigera yunnana]